MVRQRNGTAVPSLASEYLQEADLMSGLERQEAVQTAKDILGSLFQGKSWRSLQKCVALTSSVSRFRHSTYSLYSRGLRFG